MFERGGMMGGKHIDISSYKKRVTIMVVKAMVREIARLLEALGSNDTYTVHIETTKLDGKMVTLTRITKNIKYYGRPRTRYTEKPRYSLNPGVFKFKGF